MLIAVLIPKWEWNRKKSSVPLMLLFCETRF